MLSIKNKHDCVLMCVIVIISIFVVFYIFYVCFKWYNNKTHSQEEFGIGRSFRRAKRSASRGVSRGASEASKGASRGASEASKGASRGASEANNGINDAKKKANKIIKDAKNESKKIIKSAEDSANATKRLAVDSANATKRLAVDSANATKRLAEDSANATKRLAVDAANATKKATDKAVNTIKDTMGGLVNPKKCEGKDPKLNNFKNPETEEPEANEPDELNLTVEQGAVIDYIGPGYSYAKKIKPPSKMGVKSGSSDGFSTILNNTKAMAKYTGYLITGPALGNNFFIKSGTCNDESESACKGKDRWLYVENIPDGTSKCMKDIGIDIPKGAMAGLVPAMIGDVSTIAYAPIDIVGALATGEPSHSNKCKMTTKKVGPAGKLKKQTKCAPVNMNDSKRCLPSF